MQQEADDESIANPVHRSELTLAPRPDDLLELQDPDGVDPGPKPQANVEPGPRDDAKTAQMCGVPRYQSFWQAGSPQLQIGEEGLSIS
ncbi:hypothetical protein NHX12_003275 [Muraenolepis orangiensis]|uniref:Uncharacterized protein n=1 Tax=Muraenolepis orangiensis TaxID=630683 RepID=A0A9Q0IG16_9TELE|nr:hypothetical protein NHX12_003275 [Muraenolepis orangiensis]